VVTIWKGGHMRVQKLGGKSVSSKQPSICFDFSTSLKMGQKSLSEPLWKVHHHYSVAYTDFPYNFAQSGNQQFA